LESSWKKILAADSERIGAELPFRRDLIVEAGLETVRRNTRYAIARAHENTPDFIIVVLPHLFVFVVVIVSPPPPGYAFRGARVVRRGEVERALIGGIDERIVGVSEPAVVGVGHARLNTLTERVSTVSNTPRPAISENTVMMSSVLSVRNRPAIIAATRCPSGARP
jgi:hypothetical protein